MKVPGYTGKITTSDECSIWKFAPVTEFADAKDLTGKQVGWVQKGKQSFVCQRQFADRPNTTTNLKTKNLNGTLVNNNTWWLRTASDLDVDKVPDASGKFGWVPATYVTEGASNQMIPGVFECPDFFYKAVPTVR